MEAGRLDFDTSIGSQLEVRDAQLQATPIFRLMNHTSGLAAHRRFYEEIGPAVLRHMDFERGAHHIREAIIDSVTENPTGERETYSDLGYLLLERICESVDEPLSEAWNHLPGHGMDALHFCPPRSTNSQLEHYAATEDCPWRGRLMVGEVHDDNCWSMGGIAGHAGLFGHLDAVHEVGRNWLAAANGQGAQLNLSDTLVVEAINREWMHESGSRVLGWDTPSPGGSTSGQHFGPRSFGHLGFTGTSLWIDPDAQIVMTLLTNRVCPTRENWGIRKLRPALHDAGWRFLKNRITGESYGR